MAIFCPPCFELVCVVSSFSLFVSQMMKRLILHKPNINLCLPAVPGFKPKMLVVPPSGSGQSRKGFRTFHFWFFTLLGLSLPYRMWFYNQCDQLRVSVVKETSADILRNNTSAFRWFSTRKPAAALTDTGDETFRELMQALALYNKEDDAILEQAIQPINTIDLRERGAAEGAVDTVAEGGESIE